MGTPAPDDDVIRPPARRRPQASAAQEDIIRPPALIPMTQRAEVDVATELTAQEILAHALVEPEGSLTGTGLSAALVQVPPEDRMPLLMATLERMSPSADLTRAQTESRIALIKAIVDDLGRVPLNNAKGRKEIALLAKEMEILDAKHPFELWSAETKGKLQQARMASEDRVAGAVLEVEETTKLKEAGQAAQNNEIQHVRNQAMINAEIAANAVHQKATELAVNRQAKQRYWDERKRTNSAIVRHYLPYVVAFAALLATVMLLLLFA